MTFSMRHFHDISIKFQGDYNIGTTSIKFNPLSLNQKFQYYDLNKAIRDIVCDKNSLIINLRP